MKRFKGYRPSGKAWIVGCVAALSLTAIVWILALSGVSLKINNMFQMELNIGQPQFIEVQKGGVDA